MSKLFSVLEQNNKIQVLINPLKADLIVPTSEGVSELFFGNNKITVSNLAMSAMLQNLEAEVLTVEEPQIAGVSDEDIKDESKPVEFEDIVDTNDVERSEDKAAE